MDVSEWEQRAAHRSAGSLREFEGRDCVWISEIRGLGTGRPHSVIFVDSTGAPEK